MLGNGLNLAKQSNIKSRLKLAKAAGIVLYLDGFKATGSGLPSNSPLTSPWVDLSANTNNATPDNFASTTDSGYNGSTTKPAFNFDGTDDCFGISDDTSIDMTVAPLAVFATIRLNATPQTGYVFCKGYQAFNQVQYGITYGFARIYAVLENDIVTESVNGTVNASTVVNVGMIWTADGDIKIYINGTQSGNTASLGTGLTTRPNVRVGCRPLAVGNESYFKGEIFTSTVYSGANCTAVNVLKAEAEISKRYLL